jgi:RimJ/RimL family protein N-acetyltransferase
MVLEMSFREGKIIERFSVKGKGGKARSVVFRYPKKGDAKAALKMVNGIRREAEFLGMRRMETLRSERCWLEGRLSEMRQKKALVLFVEIDGRLVGDASIHAYHLDVSDHVGSFGIMLLREFTSLGIGARLAKKIFWLAKKETGFRLIDSGFFAENRISRDLHKKLGFKEYGVFPKAVRLRSGKYAGYVAAYRQIGPLGRLK